MSGRRSAPVTLQDQCNAKTLTIEFFPPWQDFLSRKLSVPRRATGQTSTGQYFLHPRGDIWKAETLFPQALESSSTTPRRSSPFLIERISLSVKTKPVRIRLYRASRLNCFRTLFRISLFLVTSSLHDLNPKLGKHMRPAWPNSDPQQAVNTLDDDS